MYTRILACSHCFTGAQLHFLRRRAKWSAFKLGPSRRSSTSDCTAHVAMGLDVEAEVKQLVEEIKRLGTKGPDGKTSVRHRTG